MRDRGAVNLLDTPNKKGFLVFEQWLFKRVSIAKLKMQEADNVQIVRDAGR